MDRRENYIKRCVGLTGDVLEVKDRELYINGKKQKREPGVQHFCEIRTRRMLNQTDMDEFEISNENSSRSYMGQTEEGEFVYLLPLTTEEEERMRKYAGVTSVKEHNVSDLTTGRSVMFPAGYNRMWTVDNYGPIYIPKKGQTVSISEKNLPLYERVIRNYEGNTLETKGDGIYINGKKTDKYTFKMDYYWMMGDNRHNSADSRMWGFVPEDHIVGKPIFIWLSLNKDKGLFNGKIRWNRFMKSARR